MGSFGSRGEIHSCIGQTPKAVSVSEVRARLHDAARFRARSTSHTVAAQDGCTKIPLAAGRGSGGRNHSVDRHFRPWLLSVRPPGSARADQVLEDLIICRASILRRLLSGVLHHGAFDDDAGGDIFPQRHQQLARQRHDGRLLQTAAVAADPFFEPQRQRRLRLMAEP
jgi:hypothetical protein